MRWQTHHSKGFSTAEMLVVLAMGAVVLGGLMITMGTLTAARGNIDVTVDVVLPGAVIQNFYGETMGVRTIPVAPSYGTVAVAEKMRETFFNDMMGATAVFCLPRRAAALTNPLRRTSFPYNASEDGPLESPLDFCEYLVKLDPAAFGVFELPLNPSVNHATHAPHLSVYLTTFSADPGRLAVAAIYEVDVIRLTGNKPWGFYASVRRYTHPAGNAGGFVAEFDSGYEVYYPPSPGTVNSPAQFASDGFSPLFVLFERSVRRAVIEDQVAGRDRFKLALEQPFYFVWWPDPGRANLASSVPVLPARDPRRAYNHMGGRTSFMFTVPLFPAL